MIKNSFLTSIRALLKNRGIFLLNILGLSIGVSACILAYTHVNYELSFDNHLSKKDHLYRLVVGNMETGEGWVKVSAPIPPKLGQEIPEITSFGRLTQYSYNKKVSVAYEDLIFNERHVYLSDPELFTMLDLKLVKGALSEQVSDDKIFISSRASKKIFGVNDPIGKVLKINGGLSFGVAGVFEDIPENSHLVMDFIVPFNNLPKVIAGTSLTGNWGQFNYFAYLELDPSADTDKVIQKIKSTVVEFGDDREMRFEDLTLQPIQDIHFQASGGNIKASYDSKYLLIYIAIALAIFIISVINFLNLSIAGSTKRIREIGIRKVMGADHKQIVGQFLLEGVILALLAIIIGTVASQLALPTVNGLLNSSSNIQLTDPNLLGILGGLVLLIAFVSALYITFFALSFHPVAALKGTFKLGSGSHNFKNGLLITQFAVSSILILSSIFIYRQLAYLQNSDLGVSKEGIVTIELFDDSSVSRIETLSDELKKLPGILSTSTSQFTPGEPNWNQTVLWQGQKESVNWNIIEAGPGFLETYGVNLLEGNMEAIESAISNSEIVYVVNESAVKQAGWEAPLEQQIQAMGRQSIAPIKGVVQDFHYQSLHHYIEPVVLVIRNSNRHNLLSLKMETNNYESLLGEIRSIYSNVMGSAPFEYAFLDDQFEELYQVEEQTSQMIGMLTLVAILLASLGMYALLSYTLKERTREIAIRKVLGIHISGILLLLSKKYVFLLLVSNLFSVAISWYLINSWIENFSYHITISMTSMIAVSFSTLLIIVFVVGSKVFQVEKINPTEALRGE